MVARELAMQFKMERSAPWALAVQLAAIGIGLMVLAVQQLSSAPPPAPCIGAAQIVYDHAEACHAGLRDMFRSLAAPARPGFVRAIYVRPEDGGSGAWLGAEHAAYLWRPGAGTGTAVPGGTLTAYADPAQARAAGGRDGGRVLGYRDVVELTASLVTKHYAP
jgi:nitrous oxide reductase accessory protein NosL